MNDLYNVTLFFGAVLIAVPLYLAIGCVFGWILMSSMHDIDRGIPLFGLVMLFLTGVLVWPVLLAAKIAQWRADVCESKSGSQPRGTMTAASPSKKAPTRSRQQRPPYPMDLSGDGSKGRRDTP